MGIVIGAEARVHTIALQVASNDHCSVREELRMGVTESSSNIVRGDGLFEDDLICKDVF